MKKTYFKHNQRIQYNHCQIAFFFLTFVYWVLLLFVFCEDIIDLEIEVLSFQLSF